MGSHSTQHFNLDERYDFTAESKKRVITWLFVGIVMFVIGLVWLMMDAGSAHDAHGAAAHGANAHGAHGGGHAPGWQARLYAVLWHNSIFFTGISLIGVFFIAVQYVAWAGWSVTIKRIPEAFGSFLPFTFAMMLITFLLGGHDIFHWTHADVVEHDEILKGKSGFLNTPSFLIRMVLFFGLWYMIWRTIRGYSLKEDQEGGLTFHNKSINISAVFLIIFGVSTSMVAWDWTMSINPHWYSTLFGWYHFASWWVSGLSTVTLTVLLLKEKGHLPFVNQNHLHDLGKFMFAFSVFWTYLWTAQFLLIYYANIPEEIIYFKERMHLFDGHYRLLFFFNVIINFLFPFLFLMTRDAKRHNILLKIAAIGLLMGHWLDFYLMIMPGVTKGTSGFGFLEFGTLITFASAFIYVISTQISKAGLLAKNHPMLQESLHHDI
jgi:hypothetical protein